MRTRTAPLLALAGTIAAVSLLGAAPALADAKSGASMTHIRTAPGLTAALEGAGVVAYSQGTATSQVIGTSLAATDASYLFHVPISANRATVQHRGGSIVLFNTTNDQQVVLQNPAIDLGKGVVTAKVAGASGGPVTVFTITNAKSLKPKTITEDGVTKTVVMGARLVLAAGVNDVLATRLGLPAGALADGARFGTADVTFYGS